MKLLVLTPQLPYPPRQGTTIRNYNLIRQLARNHTLHLFTFLAPGEVLAAHSPLHAHCARIEALPQPVRHMCQRAVATLISPLPDMGLRLECPEAHRLVQAMVAEEGYDFVQAEGIEMGQYGLRVARGEGQIVTRHLRTRHPQTRHSHSRPFFIFDDHNAEYLLQQRAALVDLRQPRRWIAAAYSLLQWRRLRRYEARICRLAAAVIAVSQADKTALERLAPGLDVTVVPNGIDLQVYQAAEDEQSPDHPTLLFTGKMDYRPNVDAALWFGHHVLPLVQARAPDVRFQIVGMNPHPRLDRLRGNPAVEITGAVDDTRPYIRNAAVYVVPMRVGGGTRFKVLEALACGRPLVSTSLGVEGIPVGDGEELLLGDTPQAFAQAVVRILADQAVGGQLSAHLGRNGRRFVEMHYGWEQIVPRLEAVYERVMRGV